MRIGIDASNLRGGGGLTHLQELLNAADPKRDGFSQITVWGGRQAIACLPKERIWLTGVHIKQLDSSLPVRLLWRLFRLPKLVDDACDIVLIPSGLPNYSSKPWVTMCHNMLPFEARERRRYKLGFARLRLELLRIVQSRSFTVADGVIFLTDYARETVTAELKQIPVRVATIPHGVDNRFALQEIRRRTGNECNVTDPFRVLYVSTVNMYKHQWNVVEAIGRLREQGVPVALDLIGGGYGPALKRMHQSLKKWDPEGSYLRYHGSIPFDVLHESYRRADAFVFASSCENMPNILLEAMAAKLPIASSNYGPMPEILGSDAIYFDPESPDSIGAAILGVMNRGVQYTESIERLAARASQLTWGLCALRTFGFLKDVQSASGQRT